MEPGRYQDAHPLPRPGRLDEPVGISEHRARLGGEVLRRLVDQPEHPRPARGLSDQRRQLADQGRELQRRRRLDRDVHRALAAAASHRLQGEDARRRRRRLADRLRRAHPVLRGERPDDGRIGPVRRSAVAADAPADAAAAARALRSADRQRHEQARLALVAVGHDGRDDGLRGQGALHQSRPLHAGLRAGRQSLDRHHLLAARDPRRASRSRPIAACARS